MDRHTIWDNAKALAELELTDPKRLEGVTTLGVDEHNWKHTGFPGDRVLTGFVDHTFGREGKEPGPAAGPGGQQWQGLFRLPQGPARGLRGRDQGRDP
ncbi:hypothetical protein GCM10009715_42230 [Paeniglutamicibacter psychrophenolicus]|uniref:Transposase n=1 Tax=Paeniglutamicibacter psychrophenolicus TaxID=257454 RepID=A0ABS4WF48_9MICC|nr:hypothetical protein [Paeniglutamicibacter psychrophenolicus]